jgi:phospho-acceptor domain-containing protein
VQDLAGPVNLTLLARSSPSGSFTGITCGATPAPTANLLENWLPQHPEALAALREGKHDWLAGSPGEIPSGLLLPVLNASILDTVFFLESETLPPPEAISQLSSFCQMAGPVLLALRLQGERCDACSETFHSVRTPLMAVRGYTKMLLQESAGAVTPTQKEYLTTVLNNAERLVRIVNEIREPGEKS